MSEAAKLIFGQPVMIDGFALNSSAVPVQHFALLNEVAQTVNALRFFNDGGIVFLWGETDLSGETGFNNELAARRADAVATYLRIAGVPPRVIQTLSLGSAFASTTSRKDAASRRVEIRFQEPPAVQPAQQAPPAVVRPQFRVDRLPPPRIPNPSQYPGFTMTPIPNTGTQYGWPGLFKDEARQTWCQNIATLITISDGSGAMGNALGALCSPIPVGGSREPFTPPLDQGTGLPNTTIFNLPPWHFNLP
jgi:OmpA family